MKRHAMVIEYQEADYEVRCPICKRKLAPVPQGDHQILASDRKCQRCKIQWRVCVRPRETRQGMAERVAFQQLSGNLSGAVARRHQRSA